MLGPVEDLHRSEYQKLKHKFTEVGDEGYEFLQRSLTSKKNGSSKVDEKKVNSSLQRWITENDEEDLMI